jgi:nicotinate-nucleotide adenylyltransferase
MFLADETISGLGYDRVILVPAFKSPFKPGAPETSAKDRLDMLAASVSGESRLTIDDTEIRREGVSYTIDTILDIVKRYRPEGKPGLILGDDLVRGFPRWRNSREITELADIVIAHRGSPEPVYFPYPCKHLNNRIIDISSGVVRDRIRNREAWRYMVPEGARIIIEDRRLYGYAPPYPGAESEGLTWHTLVTVERAVQSMVSTSRFLHSRHTALLTFDLCIRFGLDPMGGYLAGIVHDMGKSLPEAELLILAERDGEAISKLEQKKPSLLHGRAAAVLLRERFGIHNESILEAVRVHTTGVEGMCPLAKALFIADKTEVSRAERTGGFPESPAGLDRLFTEVLDDAVAYLRSQKLDLSEGTLRLLKAMHKRRDP